jgi:superoxide dismutase, Cu-Zn family
MRLSRFLIALAGMVAIVAAVAADQGAGEVNHACAVLHPTVGNNAEGTIHFEQIGKEVKVSGRVTGLSPGKHGIHIHTFGDCSAPDATSAGEHFNPDHKDHGGPRDQNRHAGDLGNVDVDADGIGNFTITDSKITLAGPNSVIGRAVIVHAKQDDNKSQPIGESGARMACGVIGLGEPK